MVFGTPGPAPTPRSITRDLSSLNVSTMSRADALADGAVSFWRLDGGEAVAMARGTSGALIISVANGPAQIVEIELVPVLAVEAGRNLNALSVARGGITCSSETCWRAVAAIALRIAHGTPHAPPCSE